MCSRYKSSKNNVALDQRDKPNLVGRDIHEHSAVIMDNINRLTPSYSENFDSGLVTCSFRDGPQIGQMPCIVPAQSNH